MSDALLKIDGEPGAPWTYADYKDWELKPGERYEIIYGEAYAMSAPNDYHQSILTELITQFHSFLRGKPCKVRPAPFDVRLFYEEDESDDTVVQPDLSVICDPKKLGREGGWGAPDFVAEILSPSNTAIEMQRKFTLYREAGVREYWIIDGENKTVIAYLFDGDSTKTQVYGAQDKAPVAILEGLAVDLEPVFTE
ncbi:MAG: Uma2 family endonuclease [Treponema sp.]|nr:Uma2 family endonuclease [Treponema sp.]